MTDYAIMDKMYVVMRKTDGKLWYDFETISRLWDISKSKANEIDKKIPQWAKSNPQMKTVQVLISQEHPYHPIQAKNDQDFQYKPVAKREVGHGKD